MQLHGFIIPRKLFYVSNPRIGFTEERGTWDGEGEGVYMKVYEPQPHSTDTEDKAAWSAHN